MPEAQMHLFISYSRKDSISFVDRLEADLRARNFYTWVDRRKLEGGQIWEKEIEEAIQRCHVLLVVISPQAVVSDYVRSEYSYAQHFGKSIIPLKFLSVELVPMALNTIQWINFISDYDQGLKELLETLNHIELQTVTTHDSVTPQDEQPLFNLPNGGSEHTLVPPNPAPVPAIPELTNLYREGLEAKAEKNLERTASLWQQVLDRDPRFLGGMLALEMENLEKELLPRRVQILRKRAEDAHSAGEWGQEIGSWEALLGLVPEDSQAKERIPIAERNQDYVPMYEVAEEFVKKGNLLAAKDELERLWHYAPDYGDPARLTQKLGIATPLNYAQKVEKAAREKAEAEAEVRRIAEIQALEKQKAEAEARRIAEIQAWEWQARVRQALETKEAERRQMEKILWTVATPLVTIGGGSIGMLLTAASSPLYNGEYLVIWGVLGAILGFIAILGIILVYNDKNDKRFESVSPFMSTKRGISRRVVIEGLVAIAGIAATGGIVAWQHILTDVDIIAWTGNEDVGQSSQAAPTLAVFKDKLYLAFVADDDSNELLIISSSDGTHWTDYQDTGRSSSLAPALTLLNDIIYLAFVANDGSNQLQIISSLDGVHWTNHPIGQFSRTEPALAVLNDTFYLAFVDYSSNELVVSSSEDGVHWIQNQPVGQFSRTAPALAVLNDTLYLAFVDRSNTLQVVSPNDDGSWTSRQNIKQASSMAPALAVFNNTLYLAFVANDSSNELLIVPFHDSVNWTNNQDIGQSSKHAPALAVLKNTLYLTFVANNFFDRIQIVSSQNS